MHCLITDGAYEEQGDGELRFLAAPPPPPERMTAVLAQVHEVIRAADDDLDIDPALSGRLRDGPLADNPGPRHRGPGCSLVECPAVRPCPFSWFSPSLGGMAGDSGVTAR
jgi:hypothetical protein